MAAGNAEAKALDIFGGDNCSAMPNAGLAKFVHFSAAGDGNRDAVSSRISRECAYLHASGDAPQAAKPLPTLEQ